MPIFKLTVYAKPVRKAVGQQGSRTTYDTQPIILYLIIIQSLLWLTHTCTNEYSSILPL
jgi:hypothetical protein